ncbi:hypothetical protein Elgi_52460 [Paenibacillus elgii]|nr:hypothetical protein Elgi_52460 [Paenibacillus elgii]
MDDSDTTTPPMFSCEQCGGSSIRRPTEILALQSKKKILSCGYGLTPVGETGIKTPYKSKQPVAENLSVTGYLVSFECELSYSK